MRQILGDGEQRRRLQRRRHRLPDVDAARDDDAVDGRDDRRVGEVDLRLVQRRARLRQLALLHAATLRRGRVGGRPRRCRGRPARSRFCSRSLRLRLQLPLGVLGACALALRQLPLARRHVGACACSTAACEQLRIDLGDHLPLLHRRVEVDDDLRDAARHLRADLHRDQRRQRAGRGDPRGDAAARDLGGLVLTARRAYG